MGDDLTTNCVVSSNGAVDINTGEEEEENSSVMIELLNKVITTVTRGTSL